MNKFSILVFFLLFVLFVAFNALFTMNEKQQGLVLQFGDPKRVIQSSGLHYKIPLIQNVLLVYPVFL